MRKERDAEQMGKPYDDRGYAGGREMTAQRSYERRDYGRVEKGQDQYHDAQYGAGVQQRYPTEVPPVEDSRFPVAGYFVSRRCYRFFTGYNKFNLGSNHSVMMFHQQKHSLFV